MSARWPRLSVHSNAKLSLTQLGCIESRFYLQRRTTESTGSTRLPRFVREFAPDDTNSLGDNATGATRNGLGARLNNKEGLVTATAPKVGEQRWFRSSHVSEIRLDSSCVLHLPVDPELWGED